MNAALLEEVKQAILEEPRRINMGTWVSIFDDEDIAKSPRVPECGTVGCIAGWVAVIDTRNRLAASKQISFKEAALAFNEEPESAEYRAIRLLGVDYSTGARLFFEDRWPQAFREKMWHLKTGTPDYAKVVAERIDHFIRTNGEE